MSQGRHFEESKPFLDEDQSDSPRPVFVQKRRNQCLVILPWLISAISWSITIYLLLSKGQYSLRPSEPSAKPTSFNDTQPNGRHWPTDLESMRSSISYETRVFTGALYWNETTKRFIRNATIEGPEYVGPPSKAIDAAWEKLLAHEWAPFTKEEAEPFRPRLKTFNAHFRFEPDVLHSLHCVNEVRKRIDADYYTKPEHQTYTLKQEDWVRIHIDHCLDQLRQTIMCFGDLSPVPLYSWKGAPLGIGQGTVHTCRKWEPIREWVTQRHLAMNDTF